MPTKINVADLRKKLTKEIRIEGPVRFVSFDKTDSGFMAKVLYRPVAGYSESANETYIHSDTLQDLMRKISGAVLEYGIE
jgi:hypothetical protein